VEVYSGLRDVISYLRTEFLVLREREKVVPHHTLLRIWVKETGVKGHTKEKFTSHFVIDCDIYPGTSHENDTKPWNGPAFFYSFFRAVFSLYA
jgi:hypothetical protein